MKLNMIDDIVHVVEHNSDENNQEAQDDHEDIHNPQFEIMQAQVNVEEFLQNLEGEGEDFVQAILDNAEAEDQGEGEVNESDSSDTEEVKIPEGQEITKNGCEHYARN
jgi:hypothetical protein